MQVDFSNCRANISAQVAIHRGPHGGVILERKGQPVDACQRYQRLQNQARQRKDINRAISHLRQHVGVAAQLVIREDLNVDLAASLCANRIGRFFDADVGRVGDRNVVGPLEGDVAALREGGRA